MIILYGKNLWWFDTLKFTKTKPGYIEQFECTMGFCIYAYVNCIAGFLWFLFCVLLVFFIGSCLQVLGNTLRALCGIVQL